MDNVELIIYDRITKQPLANLKLSDEFVMSINYSIADVRDISNKQTSNTKSIILPGDDNTNFWFGNLFDVNSTFDAFNIEFKTPAKIIVNSEVVIDGFIQLRDIIKSNENDQEGHNIFYSCVIYDNTINLITELGDKTLSDIDYSEFQHTFNKTNVENSWSHTWEDGYVYPMTGTQNMPNQFELDYFHPAVFQRKLFDKILSEAGYGWAGSFKENEQFNSEILPYVGESTPKISDEERERRSFRMGITASYITPSFNNLIYRELVDFTKIDYDFSNGVNLSTDSWTADQNGEYSFEYNLDFTLNIFNPNAYDVTGARAEPLPLQKDPISGFIPYFQNTLAANTLIIAANIAINGVTNTNSSLKQKRLLPSTIASGATYSVKPFGTGALVVIPEAIKLKAGDTVSLTLSIFQNSDAYYQQIDPTYMALVPPPEENTVGTLEFTTNNYLKNIPANSKIAESNVVEFDQFLSKKIKQKDLFNDIIKSYNLYIRINPDNNRQLLIDSYDNYYTSGITLDWTEKKDYSKEDLIEFSSHIQTKSILFTNVADSDEYNKLYIDNTGDSYGQHEYIFDNEFTVGELQIESLYSPTPLVSTAWSSVLPAIDPVKPKINPRKLLWNGLKDSHSWSLKYGITSSQTYTQYPFAGHLNDPINPTIDINWGSTETMFDGLDLSTNNNQFNTYWSNYINQLSKGKLVTSHFKLNENDISFIKDNLNTKLWIHDSYYFINKIHDYNPLNNDVTKVELIKVIDIVPWIDKTWTKAKTKLELVKWDPFDQPQVGNIGGGIVSGSGNETGGQSRDADGNTSLHNQLILGKESKLDGNNSIVVGNNSEGSGDNTIILGSDDSTATESNGLILSSNNSSVAKLSSVIKSDETTISGENSMAINSGGSIIEANNSIVIGANGLHISITQSNMIWLGNGISINKDLGTFNNSISSFEDVYYGTVSTFINDGDVMTWGTDRWEPAASQGTIINESTVLDHTQVTALNTTPVTLVAAQGVGTIIQIISVYVHIAFDTLAYSGTTTIDFSYTGGETLLSEDVLAVGSSTAYYLPLSTTKVIATENSSFILSASADPTGGDGSGDVTIDVSYRVMNI